jgi:hypothetical protein
MRIAYVTLLILIVTPSCTKTPEKSQAQLTTENYLISDSTAKYLTESVGPNGEYIDSASTIDYPLSYNLQIGQCKADTPFVVIWNDTFYWRADMNAYGKAMPFHSDMDYAQIDLSSDSFKITYASHSLHFQQSSFIVKGYKQ